MKKLIFVLFGIFFVLFTGGSLLICMITGIPSLDQTAAALYLVKAIVFPLVFPVALGSLHTICIFVTSLRKETS